MKKTGDPFPAIPFGTLQPLYERHSDEYDAAALRVLRSGWYIMGRELEAFEKEFASLLGVEYCIGVNSGLDALILSLKALGIGPGDEVIVQANTFIATVLAITANGAVPVFAEPDEFHGLAPEQAEKAITPRTRAILPVHLYGQPCDMGALCELAESGNIHIVEDCAQSQGASYRGKMTGSFGILSCFSFYPTKNLGAFGDAGAVATNDPVLAEKLRMLRNYGSRVKYENEVEGVNSRLDEIQAALLRVRLQYLEEIILERDALARLYLSGIQNPTIRLPRVREGVRHVWHQFVVECDTRKELQDLLSEQGIQTQIHYPIPPHLSKAMESLGYGKGSYPGAEHLAETVLSLPFYNGLAEKDLCRVVETLNGYGR